MSLQVQLTRKKGVTLMAEHENVGKADVPAKVEKTTPAKKDKTEKKPDKKKKAGLIARIAGWWKDTKAELKKVQWPTWKQTMNNTFIVLAFCVGVGACIWLFDLLATNLFSALIQLFHG